jgi:hypothetical protein
MQITRNSIETASGPSDWFTGQVFIDTVAAPTGGSRLSASSVHFTPGARTAWHTHPNVGMAQAGGDRRLAQKAPPEAIVVRQLVGKHLQRDPLAPLLLLGQVDGATGALANELDDAVTREDRADGQLPAHGRSLAHVQVSRG